MRIVNFFDGAQSETTPTIGNIVASALVQYPSDVSYELNEQDSPTTGNLYYNTTLNLVRYYNGTEWISIVDETTVQELHNKEIDGSSAGNNTILTTANNTEVTPTGNLVSTNTQDALEELQGDIDSHDSRLDALELDSSDYELTANKGQPNGYAPLDASSKVPAANLPSYVDDVLEYADLASLPLTGETGKIYVTLDTNKTYRWSGSSYIEISANIINNLDDLLDVVAPTPTDGQVLTWDSGTNKWINATPSAGSLNDLTDVDTSGVATNDFLKYNGTQWVPAPVSFSGTLNDISDVDTTGVVTGDSLIYNGSNWVDGKPSQLSTASGSAPSYSCRAFVLFNLTGGIENSGNVTSVTDVSVSQKNINFSTAMPTVSYCPMMTIRQSSGATYAASLTFTSASTTSTLVMFNVNESTNVNGWAVSVVV